MRQLMQQDSHMFASSFLGVVNTLMVDVQFDCRFAVYPLGVTRGRTDISVQQDHVKVVGICEQLFEEQGVKQ